MSSINLEINIPSESYKTVIDVLRAFNVKIIDLKSESDFFSPELEKKIQKARKEKEEGALKTFNSIEELWEGL